MPGKVLFVVLLAGLCLSCSRGEPATTASSERAPAAVGERDASASPARVAEQAPEASRPVPVGTSVPAPAPAPAGAQPATALAPPEAVMSEYLSEQRPPAPMISSEEYHAAFTAEKRDETWADFIEAKLRDYFARQRDADHFAIVSLGCRSSLCEVLAVNRSPQSAPVDADRWQDIVHQMRREAWYASSEIREPEVTISVTKDGRALLLTHLVRK